MRWHPTLHFTHFIWTACVRSLSWTLPVESSRVVLRDWASLIPRQIRGHLAKYLPTQLHTSTSQIWWTWQSLGSRLGTLKTLGVTLDSRLTFQHHVSSICKSCFFHIRTFRHIRPALKRDMAKSVAVYLANARLDSAKSLLYGTSQDNLHKLQRIQNTLAKLVCPGHTHSSEALRSLYWLIVRLCIDINIATLTFKLLNFGFPTYLSCLLKPYLPARALRSHGQWLLATPHVKTGISSRAFRVAAPSVWNALPLHVRSSPSIDTFKRELKTHYLTMKS